MSSAEPVAITPLQERVGHCPAGHGPLTAQRLHVAGWRTLVRGSCGVCGHTYLQDLPAGHGLLHPATLDLDTGETHAEPQAAWFSEPLRRYYEAPDVDPVRIEVDRRRSPRQGGSVLLNCLDPSRETGLLKLQHAAHHRDGGCVALVPASLEALMPSYVDEVWSVHVGFERLSHWLLDLEEWVAGRLDELPGGVHLSPAFPRSLPEEFDPHELAPSRVHQAMSRLRGHVAVLRRKVGTTVMLAGRGLAHARARRLPVPLVLTDSRGARFELIDRSETAAFLEHEGHFEAGDLDLMTHFLRPGDTALDAGANIGHFTATMARAVGPGGTVHAFEPLASNRTRLERTIELNGLDNVHVEPVAVGAAAGEVTIIDYGEGYGSWATTKPQEHDPRDRPTDPATPRTVPLVSLDEYCAAHGVERIAALKIDVEGAEFEALEGAAGLLERGAVDLLLVEVSDKTLPDCSPSWELVDRLATPPLRSYAVSGKGLVPFRSAGRLEFATVVALTSAGRARLGV